jgi:hypothetical protein
MSIKDRIEKYICEEPKYSLPDFPKRGNLTGQYLRFEKSSTVWIQVGLEKSNAYYGSANILRPIYKKVTAKAGDFLYNIPNGLFFVDIRKGQAWRASAVEPEFKPLDKDYGYSQSRDPRYVFKDAKLTVVHTSPLVWQSLKKNF